LPGSTIFSIVASQKIVLQASSRFIGGSMTPRKPGTRKTAAQRRPTLKLKRRPKDLPTKGEGVKGGGSGLGGTKKKL
jgi:hypothetical protein